LADGARLRRRYVGAFIIEYVVVLLLSFLLLRWDLGAYRVAAALFLNALLPHAFVFDSFSPPQYVELLEEIEFG
jgi:hypothetical protein